MVLNCDSSKTINATEVGALKAEVITFRSNLMAAVKKAIDDKQAEIDEAKGEDKTQKIIALTLSIGGAVVGVASTIVGIAIGLTASNPVGLAVLVTVAVILAIVGLALSVAGGVMDFTYDSKTKDLVAEKETLENLESKLNSLEDADWADLYETAHSKSPNYASFFKRAGVSVSANEVKKLEEVVEALIAAEKNKQS